MPKLLLTCCLSGCNTRHLLRKKKASSCGALDWEGSVIFLSHFSLQLGHRRQQWQWACPEEGYGCVFSLNYWVWQPVICASVFKILAPDWGWKDGSRCVFRRDDRAQMKCPACGFCQKISFCYFQLTASLNYSTSLIIRWDPRMRHSNAPLCNSCWPS